jgi:hypothetical protein
MVSAAPGGGMCLKAKLEYTVSCRTEGLTGALGLIITLGGSWPCRFCVPGPEELAGLTFIVELNRSGADSVLWPGFRELIEPD